MKFLSEPTVDYMYVNCLSGHRHTKELIPGSVAVKTICGQRNSLPHLELLTRASTTRMYLEFVAYLGKTLCRKQHFSPCRKSTRAYNNES